MSALFTITYFDEDVDVLLAYLIRARGYAAQTTHEAGNASITDAEQLAYAAAQGSALFTHNRADFEQLATDYLTAGQDHAGIFIAFRRPPYELASRLLILLNSLTADEMQNQVVYL